MLRGERKFPYEFRALAKSGNIVWVMESVTEIHYRGKPAILGNSVDITEIKQAMQEVEERKSMETSILQAIPHTVVGFQDRHIIFVNESVETVFGWRPEEIIGQSSKVFYRSIEDYEEIGSTVYHALQSQKKWALDFICRHKDGHDIMCRLNASVVGGDLTKKRIVVCFEDLTEKLKGDYEKKNLEAQLQQAQKMEAIGTLAGGIAHDFNNILGAILGNLELALLDVETDTRVRRYLERGLKASERAVELVKQILTFSRQGEQELQPLVVNPVIKEVIKLLRATLSASIEIRQDISYEQHAVIADPTQIHQIIMNLCTNAAHAMREGTGILGVGLSRVDIGTGKTLPRANYRPDRILN